MNLHIKGRYDAKLKLWFYPCTKCKKELPEGDFYRCHEDFRYYECKRCFNSRIPKGQRQKALTFTKGSKSTKKLSPLQGV